MKRLSSRGGVICAADGTVTFTSYRTCRASVKGRHNVTFLRRTLPALRTIVLVRGYWCAAPSGLATI